MEESVSTLVPCPQCGAQMPASAGFCPGCGHSMVEIPVARGKVGFLSEPIAGALAYFSFIPPIVFLTLDPFRRSRFVRFHSVQCVLTWLAGLLLAGVLRLLSAILYYIPRLGPLLVWLLAVVAGLGIFLLWIVLIVKALQGETFKLPVLGDVAERYADPL
ncbi:MAG TPA: zinc-ribbon domain-containing protein [Candidatus Sulfotelmatobacter sp.]|nr:zinc-ribbon domain-containing protein [Candidatus Sulfotelmatobacter sp.]